jgi:uncharacterized protein (TIGR03067 family)
MLALALATLTLAPTAPVPPDDANTKALKALQGKWRVVAAEEKGKAIRADDFDIQTITITGTRWVEDEGDQFRSEIKIDPSKSPAHIDLIRLNARGQPTRRIAHGIYKLDEGKLTVCFQSLNPDEEEERPTEFKTATRRSGPQKEKSCSLSSA